MSIQSDTRHYEIWLGKQCTVVKHDLQYKHERMATDPFIFLRATYYRWARKIEEWCPELKDAPHVLAVGDVHTENFGIWRDREGRLVWGINDFDEASLMPYVFDLVRLAASAWLAPGLQLTMGEVCAAILQAIERGLRNRDRRCSANTRRGCVRFWSTAATPPRSSGAGSTSTPRPSRPQKSLRGLSKVFPDTRAFSGSADVPSVSAAWGARALSPSPNGAAATSFAKPRPSFRRHGAGRTINPRIGPVS